MSKVQDKPSSKDDIQSQEKPLIIQKEELKSTNLEKPVIEKKSLKDLPPAIHASFALINLIVVTSVFILMQKKIKILWISILAIPASVFFSMLIWMVIVSVYWNMN